jgi:hypothetical protein
MNKLTKLCAQALAVSALLAGMNLAQADPIAVEFNDATASLELVSTTNNVDGTVTYRIEYVFDFTNWDVTGTCADGDDTCGAERATNLNSVHFSFGGNEDPNGDLVSVTPTAVGDWEVFNTVASAAGCGNGGSNNVCAVADDPWLAPIFDGSGIGIVYTFQFDVTYSSGFTVDIEDAAIRANFTDCDGQECDNAGLMSLRTSTKVPEPGTLALLGIGLLGMGLTRRRKLEI